MESKCIRQTELPGTTRLFADLVYHPDRVARFYSSPDSFSETAAQIDFPDDRRRSLVAALRQTNGDSPLLDALAQPGTVAVVTGQQTGLFSGPAYTVYKALTAVKLARHLTDSGIPAVPVFWLATEDHDLAEVDHAWLFNADFQPSKVQLSTAAEPNRPVGRIPLESVPIDDLRAALGTLPFTDEVAAMAADSYRPGATLGSAFRSLLKKLLGDCEVLQIDPMEPAIREIAAPMIVKALDAAPELTRALLARNRELDQAGYHAQVHVEESTSLFFLLDEGKRIALRRDKGEYVNHGHRYSIAQLQARASTISPNALLRPVVQDFLLPTIAYIGGPAELSYLAQSQVIYDRVLGRQPKALHRCGFTVIDGHSDKLMSRYHLGVPDFFHGEAALRDKIAARLVSPQLTALMSETRGVSSRALDKLKAGLTSFDVTLGKALGRSTRKIEYQLAKIESKVARQTMLREGRAAHDATSLANLIYPHKHLQERFYSILPLVAKHGPGLIPQIYEHLELDCPDHRLLIV